MQSACNKILDDLCCAQLANNIQFFLFYQYLDILLVEAAQKICLTVYEMMLSPLTRLPLLFVNGRRLAITLFIVI